MQLVRHLVRASLTHNILFSAEHVPGRHNVIPDLLSGFQFQRAALLAPWLDTAPTAIPLALLPHHMLH